MPRVDRIAEPWGTRTPYGAGDEWPARRDSYLGEGLAPEDVDGWVQTASLLHSNDDAMDVAAGVSLDWEVLAQSAQAAEDTDLASLAADCHPQTLRQMRWTNAQVKELAAQVVLGG